MSTSTKSAIEVAKESLEVGNRKFEAYSHESSPQIYTQPQLFACLVLKVFFGIDYRRFEIQLRESSELREALGLKRVPHFTTLQKAAERLMKKYDIADLLQCTMQRFEECKKNQLNFNFNLAGGV